MSASPSHPVVIVGAGPGGLCAAVALARVHVPVAVLERAPQPVAAGAGVLLQSNAMRVLAALGLEEPLRAVGATMEHGLVADWRGRPLQGLALDRLDPGGPAPLGLHRADLARVLTAALPCDTVRFGAAVREVQPDPADPGVSLEDGQRLTARAVVGADGIHSTVRASLLGPRMVRYAGYTCWRGVALGVPGLEPGHMIEHWGPGQRFGALPIGAGRAYWFATANAPAGGEDGADPLAALQGRFAGWASPVSALLAATPAGAVLRNDIHDLAPLGRWSSGAATLLGDAAHAMTPNLGQEACQAIEDAVALGWVLGSAPGDLPAALERYERIRRSRTRRFVSRSRRFGQVAQWRGATARSLRDALVAATPDAFAANSAASMLALPPLLVRGLRMLGGEGSS